MNKTVLAHHRQPDGELCVYNPKTGAYDLPLEKWRRRAGKEMKRDE